MRLCDSSDAQGWYQRDDQLIETKLGWPTPVGLCITVQSLASGGLIDLQTCDPTDEKQQLKFVTSPNDSNHVSVRYVKDDRWGFDHQELDRSIVVWAYDGTADQFFILLKPSMEPTTAPSTSMEPTTNPAASLV
jgi:hypothetical protein